MKSSNHFWGYECVLVGCTKGRRGGGGGEQGGDLGDHHVAVENTLSPVGVAVDCAADAGDDGGADGDVGYEVAVHDVDVEPVGASVVDYACAL